MKKTTSNQVKGQRGPAVLPNQDRLAQAMADSTVNEVISAWRNAPSTARFDPTRLKECFDRCCRLALEQLRASLRSEGYADERISAQLAECSERLRDRYGVVVGLIATSNPQDLGGGGGQAEVKAAAASSAQIVYMIRSEMGPGSGVIGPAGQGLGIGGVGGGRSRWKRGDAEVKREARRGASLRNREQKWGGVKLASARSALKASHMYESERPIGGAVLGGGYSVSGGGKGGLARVNRSLGDEARAQRVRAAGEECAC